MSNLLINNSALQKIASLNVKNTNSILVTSLNNPLIDIISLQSQWFKNRCYLKATHKRYAREIWLEFTMNFSLLKIRCMYVNDMSRFLWSLLSS